MSAAPAEREFLLVEDNPAEADLIQEYLRDGADSPGKVVCVASLAEAGSALHNRAVDAVLLDLRLPDGTGVECVNAIRAQAGDVPIVVLTGLDHEELALACIAAGAQDYLTKPEVRPANLKRAVGYAIARVRERRQRHRADELQRRLVAIVETSSDAIISCDVEGVIESWNRGAESIFGFSIDDAVGRHVNEVIRAADDIGAEDQKALFRQVANDDRAAVTEVERLRKDGAVIALSGVISRVCGAGGEVSAISAIYRDVTEKKRCEYELLATNEELATRARQMRALAARLNAVREEERIRLSREVHDELGQLLTGLKMDLRWIERRLTADNLPVAALKAKVVEAERLVDGAVETVQRIATELRPSALDALGLPAALRDEARRFEARTGVVVTLLVKEAAPPSAAAATALFRIFQEILTNAARHARASSLHVALDCGDRELVLTVRDDGVGFRGEEAVSTASLGLLGMRERAAELGGSLEITTGAGRGTAVTVRIPR